MTISIITIGGSNFTKNHSPIGAIIYGIESSQIHFHNSLPEYSDSLLIDDNSADRYAMMYLSNSELNFVACNIII